ncbi:MAG: hypothetical protein WD749_12015 [Phycisphaerales bacterium]
MPAPASPEPPREREPAPEVVMKPRIRLATSAPPEPAAAEPRAAEPRPAVAPSVATHSPVPASAEPPSAVAQPSAAVPAAPKRAADAKRFIAIRLPWRGPVTLTTSGALLAGTGLFAVVLAVALTVYKLGFSDGETRVLQDKGLTSLVVNDPLKAEHLPVSGGLIVPEPPEGRVPIAARPPVVTPVGSGELVSGLNYCVAASRLDKAGAERAAGFLKQNGVPAAAMAEVEGEWSGAKNAGSWRVVVLRGITGKEYGSRAAPRVEVEQQLTRLGKDYLRDPKGRIDFGQFAWDKRK